SLPGARDGDTAPAARRVRRARRLQAPSGRERDLRARAGPRALRAAKVLGRRDARGVRADGRLLAALALEVELHGTLARDEAPLRCRSCTGSTAGAIWTRRSSSTSRGTEARGRCGSETARPRSSSWTSTAR